MANRMKYSERLESPYTGEQIEIEAATESSLKNKIEKQYRKWDKEQAELEQQQYVDRQYRSVKEMNIENRRLYNAVQYHMLADIRKWPSSQYYSSLKEKRMYEDIVSPPNIKRIYKELRVPWKLRIWEHFSDSRKRNRIIAEKKAQKEFERRVQKYNERRCDYDQNKAEKNAGIDKRHDALANGDQKEIAEFFSWVIEQDCNYIDGYYIGLKPKNNLFYDSEEKILSVDLRLPSNREMPSVESFEYVEKNDSLEIKEMTKDKFRAFYRHAICDIVLRVIGVIYESDEYGLLETIVINGYRVFLDRSRGKYKNDCVISVKINREEFDELYLPNVDSEAVIKRICKNVQLQKDYTIEPINCEPLYDSGKLNSYYISLSDLDDRYVKKRHIVSSID